MMGSGPMELSMSPRDVPDPTAHHTARRLAIWYAVCAVAALHIFLRWIGWPPRPIWEPETPLWLTQLVASASLVLLAALLRPGWRHLASGLALNLVAEGVLWLALGAVMLARFH